MPIKFANDKPIFIQFAEIIKREVVGGAYRSGEKLPSVREFALKYSINPNTVQKALQLLEDEGLIVTDRTNGKFVAESPELIEASKASAIKNEVESFVERLKSLGLSVLEIKNIINKVEE